MNRTRRSTPFGWRAELLYLTMACIELVWLVPWFILIMPGANSLPGYELAAFTAANLLGALLLVRWLTRRHAGEAVTQGLFLGGLALSLFLTVRYLLPSDPADAAPLFTTGKLFFPPVVFTIVLVTLLWYRGLRVATITVTPARASFSLRVGIIFEIVAAALPFPRIQRTVLILLPLFFFVGMLSTSMARSASLRVNRDIQRSSFGAGWIGFTALIGGAISLIGFVAALLIAGFKFDAILAKIGDVLAAAVLVIATVLWPLFSAIAALIDNMLNLITNRNQPNNSQSTDQSLSQFLSRLGPQNSLSERLLSVLPMLCVGIGLALVVVVMIIRLRNRTAVTLREGEERESLDNAAILSSLKATLQRSLEGLNDALSHLSPLGAGAVAAFTIRRLYARMTALAAQHGYPRPPAQTPFEYQPSVIEAFPGFENEIALLTRAYVDVHYGELPDDPALIEIARNALERMAALPAK